MPARCLCAPLMNDGWREARSEKREARFGLAASLEFRRWAPLESGRLELRARSFSLSPPLSLLSLLSPRRRAPVASAELQPLFASPSQQAARVSLEAAARRTRAPFPSPLPLPLPFAFGFAFTFRRRRAAIRRRSARNAVGILGAPRADQTRPTHRAVIGFDAIRAADRQRCKSASAHHVAST